MTAQQKTGDTGETLAIQYLEKQGYRILAQKWHCKYGELDIVAQNAEMLIFVEVKTRRGKYMQEAFAAITPKKREKLIASAQLYLSEHGQEDIMWRIDAIGITLHRTHLPQIEHVEDALDW